MAILGAASRVGHADDAGERRGPGCRRGSPAPPRPGRSHCGHARCHGIGELDHSVVAVGAFPFTSASAAYLLASTLILATARPVFWAAGLWVAGMRVFRAGALALHSGEIWDIGWIAADHSSSLPGPGISVENRSHEGCSCRAGGGRGVDDPADRQHVGGVGRVLDQPGAGGSAGGVRPAAESVSSSYRTRCGNRLTVITGTSNSSVSTNATSPSGPNASGISSRPSGVPT